MKQPTKFQRWFLGLFGGVPKSDYKALEIRIELKEKLVELTEKQARMACAKNDELLKENELLKKQVVHDPMTPVAITRQERNIKLKEMLKSYLREAGYEEWLKEGTCRLENIEEAIDMIAEDYFKDELNRD